MEMKTKRPLLLWFLVLCLSISITAAEKNFSVTLNEKMSIGSLNDDALYMWVDIEVDVENRIYVTDTMDYSVKYFSRLGKLLKKTGRKGQGPGEFLAPRSLECSKDFIYVTDQYLQGIRVFSKDLEFIKIIPYRRPIAEFKVISDDKIAVVPFSPQSRGKLEFIDSQGRKTAEIDYGKNSGALFMDAVSFDLDSAGFIYLAYNFQDRIEKFDSQGNRIWSRALLGISKTKMKKVKEYMVPAEIIYKSIELDPQGRIYVLGGKFSKNSSRDVYIMDHSGEVLQTLTLPENSHCIYIDRNNCLYARANSGVTIKKYQMIFSGDQ